MSTLGDRIKLLRTEKRLTQEDIASALGTNRATLANWETLRTEPDAQMISRLADYFDVTTDYLLGRTNYRTSFITEAAHRTDDPSLDLPEDARKSLEDFKKFIYEKHGIKFN